MRRGHDVAWYTGDAYRDKVEATGAAFYPQVQAPDRDPAQMDAEFPERAQLKGIAKFKFDIRNVFIAVVPGQVADLENLLDEVRPDVIVAEPGMAAAASVIEDRHGIPWATCGISAFTMKSVDTAPFGLGLKPAANAVGRLRNRELLLPTLEALRDEPVQVIAVTGGPDPADLPHPPENARVERFVPFAPLMPHVSAMVTNGGYGGLHYALAHGIPLVVAGTTEEKPELVARVNWSGAGIGMRTQSPSPARLRTAVRRLLDEPRFACRALALQAEMARYDGPATAADLIEQLAPSRAGAPS